MAMPLAAHRFTVAEYHRMGEAGVFRADDRVELIDGQVLEMSPIGPRHASCVRRLTWLLARPLLGLAMIDVQNPVVLGEHDVPQPDIALLKPRADAYPHHPGPLDVLLVIEVADTSAAYDRDVKIPRYASAGIPEAWLVDLSGDRVEVYRSPTGGRYAAVTTISRGATLAPLALPHVRLGSDEILG